MFEKRFGQPRDFGKRPVESKTNGEPCPVKPFESAGEDYLTRLETFLDEPNAYFRAFGPEARDFQRRHPSERLRTMTLVAPAAKLAALPPVVLMLDGSMAEVASWEDAFAITLARLAIAHSRTFVALQNAGALAWLGLGSASEGRTLGEAIEAREVHPTFDNLTEVVWRVQWLFLVCGIRLNEVIVQVNPYSDEDWKRREGEIHAKRKAKKNYLDARGLGKPRADANSAWDEPPAARGEPPAANHEPPTANHEPRISRWD